MAHTPTTLCSVVQYRLQHFTMEHVFLEKACVLSVMFSLADIAEVAGQ